MSDGGRLFQVWRGRLLRNAPGRPADITATHYGAFGQDVRFVEFDWDSSDLWVGRQTDDGARLELRNVSGEIVAATELEISHPDSVHTCLAAGPRAIVLRGSRADRAELIHCRAVDGGRIQATPIRSSPSDELGEPVYSPGGSEFVLRVGSRLLRYDSRSLEVLAELSAPAAWGGGSFSDSATYFADGFGLLMRDDERRAFILDTKSMRLGASVDLFGLVRSGFKLNAAWIRRGGEVTLRARLAHGRIPGRFYVTYAARWDDGRCVGAWVARFDVVSIARFVADGLPPSPQDRFRTPPDLPPVLQIRRSTQSGGVSSVEASAPPPSTAEAPLLEITAIVPTGVAPDIVRVAPSGHVLVATQGRFTVIAPGLTSSRVSKASMARLESGFLPALSAGGRVGLVDGRGRPCVMDGAGTVRKIAATRRAAFVVPDADMDLTWVCSYDPEADDPEDEDADVDAELRLVDATGRDVCRVMVADAAYRRVTPVGSPVPRTLVLASGDPEGSSLTFVRVDAAGDATAWQLDSGSDGDGDVSLEDATFAPGGGSFLTSEDGGLRHRATDTLDVLGELPDAEDVDPDDGPGIRAWISADMAVRQRGDGRHEIVHLGPMRAGALLDLKSPVAAALDLGSNDAARLEVTLLSSSVPSHLFTLCTLRGRGLGRVRAWVAQWRAI